MRVVPPPAQLLVGENLLVGGIGLRVCASRSPSGSETIEIGAVGIEPAPRVVAVVVVPVELLAALDVGLEIARLNRSSARRRGRGRSSSPRRRPGAGGRRLQPVRSRRGRRRRSSSRTAAGNCRSRRGRCSATPIERRDAAIGRSRPGAESPSSPTSRRNRRRGSAASRASCVRPCAVEDRAHVGGERGKPGDERIVPDRAAGPSVVPALVQPGPRIVSSPRNSEPITNRSTPPATMQS